jgi:hypothetical protein
MSEFNLDDHVPIPTDFHTTGTKYPFEEMGIGQSFFISPEYEDESVKRLGNRIAQARQSYQKRLAKQGNEVRFTQRLWTEDGIAGYRVWRVE